MLIPSHENQPYEPSRQLKAAIPDHDQNGVPNRASKRRIPSLPSRFGEPSPATIRGHLLAYTVEREACQAWHSRSQPFHSVTGRFGCLEQCQLGRFAGRLAIPDGNIIVIRFIRSKCILDIFGEKFKVSKSLVYSYVKAVIVTQIHRLQLYLGEELVDTFEYQLSMLISVQ